jgi:CheY-like chemotaxis protein
VHRQRKFDVVGSNSETLMGLKPSDIPTCSIAISFTPWPAEIMEPASDNRMPADVLIVEDDPIIALGFEDTIVGFGVKTVRAAATVARALDMIAERAPDFAVLDVGLLREKSFAIAERLTALKIPFVFVTGYGADGIIPPAFAGTPRLAKPCSSDALAAVMQRPAGGTAEG